MEKRKMKMGIKRKKQKVLKRKMKMEIKRMKKRRL